MTHAPATDAQSNHHPSADDAQIRLAAVSYLNTTPLIEGLAKLERVRLTLSAPAQLIALLDQDHADLALASVIDAAHQPDAYSIIPAGIIGCDGPTLTVRVFSKAPIEDATTLHADIDSHTSVALARIVLHHLTGRDPEVHPFDADQWAAKRTDAPDTPWPDTPLPIGDKDVTHSPPAPPHPHHPDPPPPPSTRTSSTWARHGTTSPASHSSTPHGSPNASARITTPPASPPPSSTANSATTEHASHGSPNDAPSRPDGPSMSPASIWANSSAMTSHPDTPRA